MATAILHKLLISHTIPQELFGEEVEEVVGAGEYKVVEDENCRRRNEIHSYLDNLLNS